MALVSFVFSRRVCGNEGSTCFKQTSTNVFGSSFRPLDFPFSVNSRTDSRSLRGCACLRVCVCVCVRMCWGVCVVMNSLL